MPEPLRLFTFSPAHGLPTGGPFGLKLEACLRMTGVPYERVYEDDLRKGPKRKSPWIEQGAVKMGDTELILQHLGVDPDAGLTALQRAQSHTIRRMLEEHYHAVFEWEMFVDDAGWAYTYATFKGAMPALVAPLVGWYLRSHFKKHLFERGIGRHAPAEIQAMGKADLDALSALLGDREWLVADHPSKVDATAFGLLALTIQSGLPTPVASHARTLPNLVAYVERAKARFFPDFVASGVAA
jgi:glutathione S-transferase